ncbi:MAG: endonuclease, partial [Gemmatimonadetes bacterium HGW-Gemmatimonadetes-1]
MLMLFTAATALLTAPLSHDSAAALRWGGMGHRVIARVAAGRLSPEAKREVRRLLGRETLAKVSTWADEVRRDRP